jgi:hypothetical protein
MHNWSTNLIQCCQWRRNRPWPAQQRVALPNSGTRRRQQPALSERHLAGPLLQVQGAAAGTRTVDSGAIHDAPAFWTFRSCAQPMRPA